MDSSNSPAARNVDIVLGRYQVPTHELTPADRLVIVDDALDTVNALLKYFPEGQNVENWINQSLRPAIGSRRETNSDVLALPPELDASSRLFLLRVLGDNVLNLAPWGAIGTYGFLSEWLLMLTRNGEWVLWTAHYRMRAEADSWPRQHKIAHAEEALSSTFVMLEDADLMALLEYHPRLCRGIVDRLHSLTLEGISRRREALDDMEYASSVLEGYLSRQE